MPNLGVTKSRTTKQRVLREVIHCLQMATAQVVEARLLRPQGPPTVMLRAAHLLRPLFRRAGAA